MRRRDDNALEVWVNDGVGTYPVGWLTGFAGTMTRIQINSRTFILDIRERQFKDIDLADLKGRSHARMIMAEVPGYAEEHKLPMYDGVKFGWRVLAVSLDDYEWIFDLDVFVPEDTEDDLDSPVLERPTFTVDVSPEKADIHGWIVGDLTPSTYTPFKSVSWGDETTTIDYAKIHPDYDKLMAEEVRKAHDKHMLDSMIYSPLPRMILPADSVSTSTVAGMPTAFTLKDVESAMREIKFEHSSAKPLSFLDYVKLTGS